MANNMEQQTLSPTTALIQGIKIPMLVFASAFLVPFIVFYVLRTTPVGAAFAEDTLMHSVLNIIIIAFSLYTIRYYYKLYIKSPKACFLFSSLSIFVFTAIFSIHSAVMMSHGTSPEGQMLLDVTEYYSLFFSALFFIGMLLPFKEERGFLYDNRKKIYLGVTAALFAGMAGVLVSESAVGALYGAVDSISVLTAVILVTMALFLSFEFSKTRNPLFLYFIFGLIVMASSGYIPLFYAGGGLLWWYVHLAFPMGYTAIFIGFINYERGDLNFRLFFGGIPFYKKIGTKLALTIFMTGLIPLLSFGFLVFVAAQSSLAHPVFGGILSPATPLGDTESLRLLMFRLFLMISLLFVLSAFFSFYFAGKLVLPLKKLNEAAGKVAAGEIGAHVDIKTGDEIETLGDSFNIMATKLSMLYADMDEQIKEKTAELSRRVAETDALIVSRTRELSQERARLIASINSIPFGFLIANREGLVIMENAVLMKLFGLEEKKGIVIDDISKHLQKDLDLRARVEDCMKEQKVCEIKEILFGSKFLRGIIAPIVTGDDFGWAIGYVILFEDITEAKVLERSRDEFFAVASHELRTPLTAIRGNTAMLQDMLKDKDAYADTKDMLADIHEASVRLIAIVNDFLDVAGLEQGNVNVVMENARVDITLLIEHALRNLKDTAEKKGLGFRFNKPDHAIFVLGDNGRLTQVLVNIIGNAIKFSPGGFITIEISPEPEKKSVKVSVKDSGIGIATERQTLLFHKFQQAGEQILARDVTQGTGLGLYISKLLIERMGGTIGLLKSVPGEGSTFYFTVPIAK
ncbi:MAG: ATP-binding protein [bacterium]|nr:ATP-binding protein [bacterium]